MKTLTTEQIQYIENILTNRYNIKYQDTREEVLDHIACEVEDLMNEGVEFSEAFETVLINWKDLLKTDPYYFYKNTPYYISKNWIEQDSSIKNKSILFGLVIAGSQLATLLYSDKMYLITAILFTLISINTAVILNQLIKKATNEHATYLNKKVRKVISFNIVTSILLMSMLLFQDLLIAGDMLSFSQGLILACSLFVPFSLIWVLMTYKSYKRQLTKLL